MLQSHLRFGNALLATSCVMLVAGCGSSESTSTGPAPFFTAEKTVQPGEKWVLSVDPKQAKKVRFRITSQKPGFKAQMKRLGKNYKKKRKWEKYVLSWWSFITPGDKGQKMERTIAVPAGTIYFVVGKNLRQKSAQDKDKTDEYRVECFREKDPDQAIFDEKKTVTLGDSWACPVKIQQEGEIKYRVTSQRMLFEVMVITEEGYRKLEEVGLPTMAKEAATSEFAETHWFMTESKLERTMTAPPSGSIELTISSTKEASKIRLECFKVGQWQTER